MQATNVELNLILMTLLSFPNKYAGIKVQVFGRRTMKEERDKRQEQNGAVRSILTLHPGQTSAPGPWAAGVETSAFLRRRAATGPAAMMSQAGIAPQ